MDLTNGALFLVIFAKIMSKYVDVKRRCNMRIIYEPNKRLPVLDIGKHMTGKPVTGTRFRSINSAF